MIVYRFYSARNIFEIQIYIIKTWGKQYFVLIWSRVIMKKILLSNIIFRYTTFLTVT